MNSQFGCTQPSPLAALGVVLRGREGRDRTERRLTAPLASRMPAILSGCATNWGTDSWQGRCSTPAPPDSPSTTTSKPSPSAPSGASHAPNETYHDRTGSESGLVRRWPQPRLSMKAPKKGSPPRSQSDGGVSAFSDPRASPAPRKQVPRQSLQCCRGR